MESKKKILPNKLFKGCIKIPLRTDLSESELFKLCTWHGDWKTKGKIISSKRRKFTINTYVFNQQGQSENTTYTSQQALDQYEIRTMINHVINDFQGYDDVDYLKSFMTVSC